MEDKENSWMYFPQSPNKWIFIEDDSFVSRAGRAKFNNMELLKFINTKDCETTTKTTKILGIFWMILKSHP